MSNNEKIEHLMRSEQTLSSQFIKMRGSNKRTSIINNNNNSKKIKQASNSDTIDDDVDPHHHNEEEELPSGFPSWPPRSYTCRFCKKEFISAQALGGHMNIHKVDRAKLRLYSTLREEMTKKKAKIHQDLGSLKHKKASSSIDMLITTKKNEEIDALDLHTGLQKQDLDLELRLGFI